MNKLNQDIFVYPRKKDQKERLSEIQSHGYFTCEIHMHTTNSDGITKPKRALSIAKKKGIHIAITDHNTILDFDTLTKEEQSLVIPAIEVKSVERVDVIGYFYDAKTCKTFYETYLKGQMVTRSRTKHSFAHIVDVLHAAGAVIMVPHLPYPEQSNIFSLKLSKKTLNKIHCFEVFNAARDKQVVVKSHAFARKHKKNVTVGSDAHTPFAIGNCIIYCTAKTKKAFLDCLKKGSYDMIATPTPKYIRMLPLYKWIWYYMKR